MKVFVKYSQMAAVRGRRLSGTVASWVRRRDNARYVTGVLLFINSSRHERIARLRAGEYTRVEGIAGLGTWEVSLVLP